MRSNSNDEIGDDLLNHEFFSVVEHLDDGTPLCGIDYCVDMELNAIWHSLTHEPFKNFSFLARKNAFLKVLQRLLKDGRIKLRKMNGGPFLESTPEELVDLFRKAWPESIEASGYEDFNWWFFDDDCPAGVAWRLEDGSYR